MRSDMSRLAVMVGLFVGGLALFVVALVIALGVPSVTAGSDSDPVALQPNPGHSSSEDGWCFSVTVDPPAPTESDYVKITVAGWLPNPCFIANSSHTVSGNVVYITVEVVRNPMLPPEMLCPDVVMPFSVTEEIGQLPAGFYDVQTTLNSSQPPCAPMTPSFEVQPAPRPAVGGMVELRVGSPDSPTRPADGSGSSALYAALVGAAAAGAIALTAGAWYARRRWNR